MAEERLEFTENGIEDRLDSMLEIVSRFIGTPKEAIFGVALASVLPSKRKIYHIVYLTDSGMDNFSEPSEKKSITDINFWSKINLNLELAARINKSADLYPYYNLSKSFGELYGLLCQRWCFLIDKKQGPSGAIAELIPLNLATIPANIQDIFRKSKRKYHFIRAE